MKQTAIEWLINEHFGSIENCTPDFRNKIKQAKEMEKQQIIDSHLKGQREDIDFRNEAKQEAEQYYNETFKQ
jgi:hypothetical protein